MEHIQRLYVQYSQPVFRFALGLCGDRHLANDLVAESFVRLMLSTSEIELKTVQGYLCTIARNLYLKEWRRRSRNSELEDFHQDPAPGPEQVVSGSQSLRRTLDALQTLPEVDRFALLMRAQDEVPYEDIAKALGISVASAKVKVCRSRIKLAQLLKEGVS
jgi:RNA polymerase sigma-70 factor (ECF subfamily)